MKRQKVRWCCVPTGGGAVKDLAPTFPSATLCELRMCGRIEHILLSVTISLLGQHISWGVSILPAWKTKEGNFGFFGFGFGLGVWQFSVSGGAAKVFQETGKTRNEILNTSLVFVFYFSSSRLTEMVFTSFLLFRKSFPSAFAHPTKCTRYTR